jgi:hypothetical protein
MSGGNVDRIPVNQLSDRYKLARSAVYKRMADLGIEREKIGNRAYVSDEQVALLDELHDFIQIGGNVAEFMTRKGLDMGSAQSGRPANQSGSQSGGQSADASGGLALNQSDMVKLVSAIAAEITAQIRPAVVADPLAYYESLERAASNGWKLRTSEIATLLKLDPNEINRYGQTFYEAGFVFNRAGFRSGGEVAWLVSKG